MNKETAPNDEVICPSFQLVMSFYSAEDFYNPSFSTTDNLLTLCYAGLGRENHIKQMRPPGNIIRYSGQWDYHLAGDPWLSTFCSHSPRW